MPTSSRSFARPVVDLTRSRAAQLKPLPLSAVRLEDTFWQPRRQINRRETLKSQFEHLQATPRLANFRRAAGLEKGEFEGLIFDDSDVYKWLEAASSTLAQDDDADVRAMMDEVARTVAAAQQPDGFLHSYYTLHPEKERWENLRDNHQLYCMGHFLQAAVAHSRATGERELLDVATRLADCIDHDFGWGKREETDGHEEIELALVELYRETNEARYLQLAQFFIDVRGRGTIGGRDYNHDHVPFRVLDRMTGHAVRALYYATGAADVFLETGEDAMWNALEEQWKNFTQRQMYVTGGAGSRWEGEAFGFDFELPNQRAYTETCAAIAVVMWAWRMGQHSGEARFFSVLERALYNGVLSGLSLRGDEYFYQNPLADDGAHRRQKWFGCACCPPNIARLLAQLPGYFYSVSPEGIWAHLFAQSQAEISLPDGATVRLKQQTNFPWDGEIAFQIEESPESEWSLFVRIPEWARGATLQIEGETREVKAGEYHEIRRVWKNGDMAKLNVPMETRFLRAHPHVTENRGRVAVMRGPLVYCAEALDFNGVDVRDLQVSPQQPLVPVYENELLGGVVTLQGEVEIVASGEVWQNELYAPVADVQETSPRATPLKLIPYYAWANRAAAPMQVWLQEKPSDDTAKS